MADVDFDEFEDGYAAPNSGGLSRWVHLAGAACSVALVLGLGVWGYKLAVRDVSGIPVVRALEGPLRIAPENPGGEVALHQGLSVNAVAAAGTAMPLPDTLKLAPREIELAAEDEAGLAVLSALPAAPADTVAEAPLAGTAAPELSANVAPVEIAAPEVVEPVPTEAASALAPLAEAEPLPATQEDAVAAALAAALADTGEAAAEVDAGGEAALAVAKSLRPPARPARAAAAVEAPVAEAAVAEAAVAEIPGAEASLAETAAAADAQGAAVAPGEIDPSTIATGTRLVQLGAFDDDAGARAEWAKLQGQFPELFGAKAMVVQSAQSGGRTFFRLRAHGFADEDEARRFCAALLAENASCIPVAQR